LNLLTPLIAVCSDIGGWLLFDPLPTVTWLGVLTAAALLAAAAWAMAQRQRRLPIPALCLAAVALALGAQLLMLHHRVGAGVGLYLAAIGAIIAARFTRSQETVIQPVHDDDARQPFTRSEANLLLVICAAAVLFRFYGLNHLVDYFEGEVIGYAVGATNVPGMLLANVGASGSWAPLGLLSCSRTP